MTNKRKKLVRSISRKTGMTHAAAVNHLRGGLRISRKPFEWKEVFVQDIVKSGGGKDIGGFFRMNEDLPVYKVPEGVTAYIIAEEGKVILSISKLKNVIVPLTNYHVKTAIEERMFALIEVGVSKGGASIQLVPKAEDYYRKCFQGQRGTVRVQNLQDDIIVGILGYAGIFVSGPTGQGLMVFDDRIKFCKEVSV